MIVKKQSIIKQLKASFCCSLFEILRQQKKGEPKFSLFLNQFQFLFYNYQTASTYNCAVRIDTYNVCT